MRMIVLSTCLAGLLAGCSGGYSLAVPDAAGPTGGSAPATVRLQRREVWVLRRPVNEAVMRMELDRTLRAGYTNKQGYATVAMPVPDQPGRHDLAVRHLDRFGDEVEARGNLYALNPQVLTLAVDWDALDAAGVQQAAAALRRLGGEGVQIAYLAGRRAMSSADAHDWLHRHGFPGGPVLSWRAKQSWFSRTSRLTGALPAVRAQLPGMVLAVTGEDDAVASLQDLNIIPVWLGRDPPAGAVAVPDWPTLAARIVETPGLLGVQDFATMPPRAVRQALQPQP